MLTLTERSIPLLAAPAGSWEPEAPTSVRRYPWTGITSSTGDLGGILGIATDNVSVDDVISIGNLSGSGSNINRIYGNIRGVAQCAVTNGTAYSGQIVGTGTSVELLTATYLSAAGEFLTQNFFRNRGRIGNSFDIEGSSGYRIEDGYLPQLKNVSLGNSRRSDPARTSG